MAERYCVSHALRRVCEQHYNDDDRRVDAEFMREYNRQDEGAAAPPTRQEFERAILAEAGVDEDAAAIQQEIIDASNAPRAVFHFHEPMGLDTSSSSIVRALGSRLFLSVLPIVRSQNAQEHRRHPVETRPHRIDELQDRVRSLQNMVPRDLRMWTRADPPTSGSNDSLTYTLYRSQMEDPMRRAFYSSMRQIGVSCRRVNDGYRLTLPANNRERFLNAG